MDAANAASACPSRNTWTKCPVPPAPRKQSPECEPNQQLLASGPVPPRPPCVNASQCDLSSESLASMATTTACDPKRSAIPVIKEGSARAAELMLILSAPAEKTADASSRVRIPPPTV